MPFIKRYVPDQYKTHKMCDKVILESGGVLRFVPDWYKNKKICNKDVDNYALALELVPDCYNSKKKCVTKLFILILLQYNTFLIDISLKKYAINMLMLVFFQLVLFLIMT